MGNSQTVILTLIHVFFRTRAAASASVRAQQINWTTTCSPETTVLQEASGQRITPANWSARTEENAQLLTVRCFKFTFGDLSNQHIVTRSKGLNICDKKCSSSSLKVIRAGAIADNASENKKLLRGSALDGASDLNERLEMKCRCRPGKLCSWLAKNVKRKVTCH